MEEIRIKNEFFYSPGFTLIETLLTMSLVAIVAAFSFPIFHNLIVKNDLEAAASVVVQNLRAAQSMSMNGENDYRWGVEIQKGSITVFATDGSGSRIAGIDDVYAVPESAEFSGLSQIIFNKLTGIPDGTGTITVRDYTGNETKTITINEKGLVGF